jgi:hypothetical protein
MKRNGRYNVRVGDPSRLAVTVPLVALVDEDDMPYRLNYGPPLAQHIEDRERQRKTCNQQTIKTVIYDHDGAAGMMKLTSVATKGKQIM